MIQLLRCCGVIVIGVFLVTFVNGDEDCENLLKKDDNKRFGSYELADILNIFTKNCEEFCKLIAQGKVQKTHVGGYHGKLAFIKKLEDDLRAIDENKLYYKFEEICQEPAGSPWAEAAHFLLYILSNPRKVMNPKLHKLIRKQVSQMS